MKGLFQSRLVLNLAAMVLVLAGIVVSLSVFIVHARAASSGQSPLLVGPKEHYLSLGASNAVGFQPNGDLTHGYVPDLFQILQNEGVKDFTNLACLSDETTETFIRGGTCSYSPYSSQLEAAVAFLHANAGKVSPVTLDIGSNDVIGDVNPTTCRTNEQKFSHDLAMLDSNLKDVILPALQQALTVKGHVTGSIVMMNFYDPFQNICPNTVPFIQTLNQHLANDVSGFGIIADVFTAFGGPSTPNSNICTYTWMCTPPPLGPDAHATTRGYQVIANAFAAVIPTD